MTLTGFWSFPNWKSRRRSWPYEPSRLEILAARAGLDDEQLRALLERVIQQRLRQRGEAWERLDRTLEKREAL